MQDRIAFVIHSLKTGGSERFLVRLVNGLHREGMRPLVVLLERDNQLLPELHKGIDVHVVSRMFRYDVGLSARLRSLLRSLAVRQVFCVEPYAFFMARFALAMDRSMHFYLSLHNSLPIGMKKYMMDLAFLRFFTKRDRAIFICHFQKSCFRERYRFDPGISHVIYNGVDTEQFSPAAARAALPGSAFNWRERIGIPEGSPVFLMVGRLSGEKGHRFAVSALSRLRKFHGIDAHLVVVGAGPEEQRLRVQVEGEALGAFVHFEGLQTEVRHYMMKADVFVMTSVSETFSLAALEAMSMGMPCSLTRVGGAEEMIGEGMGTLCRSGDVESIARSWQETLEGGHSREYIRAELARRFSEPEMIRQYKEVLSET